MATTALDIRKATTDVGTQIKGFVMQGELHLPPDYSAANALKSAELLLPSILTSEKIPVLEFCTEQSIKNSLLAMCKMGLNPDKGQCYFIPFGKDLRLMRSQYGDVAVAKQVDPTIEDIFDAVVFEGDKFEYEIKRGKVVSVTHSQKLENKNKPIVAAYATVVYRNGNEVSTIMTYEQIKQAWKQSNTKPVLDNGTLDPKSTHSKFSEEMAKKTVTHRACKAIIRSSNDRSLFTRTAQDYSDETDAIEIDAEIESNANSIDFDKAIEIEAEFEDVVMEKVPPEPAKTKTNKKTAEVVGEDPF